MKKIIAIIGLMTVSLTASATELSCNFSIGDRSKETFERIVQVKLNIMNKQAEINNRLSQTDDVLEMNRIEIERRDLRDNYDHCHELEIKILTGAN